MCLSFLRITSLFYTVLSSTNNASDIVLYDEDDDLSKAIGIKWNITQAEKTLSTSSDSSVIFRKFFLLITLIYDIPWMSTCLKEHILINMLIRHLPVMTEEDAKYECSREVVHCLNSLFPMGLLGTIEKDDDYNEALPYLRVFNLLILTVRHQFPTLEKDSIPLASIINLFSKEMTSLFCGSFFLAKLNELFIKIVADVTFLGANDAENCDKFFASRIEFLDHFMYEWQAIFPSDEFPVLRRYILEIRYIFERLHLLASKKDFQTSYPSTESVQSKDPRKNGSNPILPYFVSAFPDFFRGFFSLNEQYLDNIIDCVPRISNLKSKIDSFKDDDQLKDSLIEIFDFIYEKTDTPQKLYVFKKYCENNISIKTRYRFTTSGGSGQSFKIYLFNSSTDNNLDTNNLNKKSSWRTTFAKTFFYFSLFLAIISTIIFGLFRLKVI